MASSTDESKPAPGDQDPNPATQPKSTVASAGRRRRLRLALTVVGALVIVFIIVPRIFHAWHTVSTDDAYVNSYVTFVAPLVTGQVARVRLALGFLS